MEKTAGNNSFLPDHMLLIGVTLAGIYWVLDSFMSIVLSYENSLLEQVIGFDLVETSPNLDFPNRITCNLAAKTVIEFISFIKNNKK